MKYVCATATSHSCATAASISALANKQLAGGRKRGERKPIQNDYVFYPLTLSIFSKPKWCEILRPPQLHRGLKPQNTWHGRSWTPQPERRWARSGYRAALPAQGQSNPSKSLAEWLCSPSSSQSPASGSLATCLPLGRTKRKDMRWQKNHGIGKMLLPRTSFSSFSLKMKSSIFQTTGI